MAFHQFIEEILPVDLTLLFALVFFIIAFFGYLFYRYRRARRARTILVLEIGNAENSLQSLKDLTSTVVWPLPRTSCGPVAQHFATEPSFVLRPP